VVTDNRGRFKPAHGGDPAMTGFGGGTMIRTARGDLPIEAVEVGDRILTVEGGYGSVRHVGRREIDCARHSKPKRVWPIRVLANAIAPGTPARDLYLSPDHAVYLDGILVPIKRLANGVSVRQIHTGRVEYYFLELDNHDILLANGLPVESGGIGPSVTWQTTGGVVTTPLHNHANQNVRRDEGTPRRQSGPLVAAVRLKLDKRAAAIFFSGQPMALPDQTNGSVPGGIASW